MSFCL